MKFNWGMGIAIFMTCFVIFIVSFVVKSSFLKTDLYAEDYYQQELDYQEIIDARVNSSKYKGDFFITQSSSGIVVNLPKGINWEDADAAIHFYRPSDANLDKTISVTQNKDVLNLSRTDFKKGAYEAKLTWSTNDKNYILEYNINFE